MEAAQGWAVRVGRPCGDDLGGVPTLLDHLATRNPFQMK